MIDRKANLQVAWLHADYCNAHRDPEKYPEGWTSADFLPELPEDRTAREAAEAEAELAPSDEAFAAWKNSVIGPQTKVGQLAALAAAAAVKKK